MTGHRPEGLRVLLIRAQPLAIQSAERLRALGYCPVLAPVQKIMALEAEKPRLRGGEVLVLTSSNAVPHLRALVPDRTREVWCVGERTAQATRQAGFTQVHSASGDAQALVRAMVQAFPNKRPLLHLAGREAGHRFVEAMRGQGFIQARALPVYMAQAQALGEKLRLSAPGEFDVVLVHSRGAARDWVAQLSGPMPQSAWAVAISEQAAVPLAKIFARERIRIATHPDEASMFAVLASIVTGG